MNFKTRCFNNKFLCVIYSWIFFYIFSTTHASDTSSINIECTYQLEDRGFGVGRIYECLCKQTLNGIEQETLINNVNGNHLQNNTNENVQGIYMIGASYLPKNIHTYFPNLIRLRTEKNLKKYYKK